MIFNRLAEKCGFTTEQVLDLTPHLVRTHMSDESPLRKSDDLSRENEIRTNLKFYEGRRLLTMKFQQQLDEHLAKTGEDRKQTIGRIKRLIVAGISNG